MPRWRRWGAAESVRGESYTLEATLLGLVGYVNTPDEVWALLPDASPGAPLPPGGVSEDSYPRHFAYLRVAGRNVKGVDGGEELLIPLKGYDVVPQLAFASGDGLPPGPFRQPPNNPVDIVDPSVVQSPEEVRGLASRVRLPRRDLEVVSSTENFARILPVQVPLGCVAGPPQGVGIGTRVEAVRWSTTLTAPLVLDFLHYQDPQKNFRLTIGPAASESHVRFEVVNQVSGALVDADFEEPHHFEPYRWYYRLAANQADCRQHYYPVPTVAGGKRCPQKLYTLGQ